MKQSVLVNFDDTYLTIAALLIFVAVFISVVAWVYRKGSGKFYEHMESLPLELEDTKNGK